MNHVTSAPPVLSGTGLAKSFGSTRALDGVDVAVRAGESLAVMGPSGSGKSTLLHCLAGIERPDEGQVVLAGDRIDQLREPARSELRRTRFGFVFQFGQLLPELPAVENIALPLMLGGMPRGQAVRQARAWFAPLGLAGKEDSRPGALSGGQAQRVALARALVAGAQVVFADEPTGALDQTTGQEVIGLLTEVTRSQNAALVMVTHDRSVADRCDRTVEVRDGRIVRETATTASAPADPRVPMDPYASANPHASANPYASANPHASANPYASASIPASPHTSVNAPHNAPAHTPAHDAATGTAR